LEHFYLFYPPFSDGGRQDFDKRRFLMRQRMFVKLFVGIIVLICMSYQNEAVAEVNINVGIIVPPLPPVVIPAPPPVFVIPGTYVYFAPKVDVDIFFYHGYWYRPYRGHWYDPEATTGNGFILLPRGCSSVLLNLPSDFHHVPPGRQHIPSMDTLKGIGRRGREKDTGKGMAMDMKKEKGKDEKTGDITGQGKIRGLELYLPDF
jgi:hypothetical protein